MILGLSRFTALSLLFIIVGCNTTDADLAKNIDPGPPEPIEVTYEVAGFSINARYEAFVIDSLVADTFDVGRWSHTSQAFVGDSIKAVVTFTQTAAGGTTIALSPGGRCNFAAGWPAGHSIECKRVITQSMADAHKRRGDE